jgi:hypothetical protein
VCVAGKKAESLDFFQIKYRVEFHSYNTKLNCFPPKRSTRSNIVDSQNLHIAPYALHVKQAKRTSCLTRINELDRIRANESEASSYLLRMTVTKQSEQPHTRYYGETGWPTYSPAATNRTPAGQCLLLRLCISRPPDRFLKKTVREKIFVACPPTLLNLCQLSN